MKKIFFFLYIISFVLTGSFFVFLNVMTHELTATSRSSNGNPYLFPLLFIQPFILFFLYGTVEYSMRWFVTLKIRTIRLSAILSISAASAVVILTLLRISEMRTKIVQVNDSFTDVSQVGYLNIYTNNLFFNAYTFAGIVLVCFFIGCLWALSRKKRKTSQKNNTITLVK